MSTEVYQHRIFAVPAKVLTYMNIKFGKYDVCNNGHVGSNTYVWNVRRRYVTEVGDVVINTIVTFGWRVIQGKTIHDTVLHDHLATCVVVVRNFPTLV